MTKAPLEPDRDQLEIFVEALLRHRGDDGYLSLRVFKERDKVPLFKRLWTVRLNGGSYRSIIDTAEDLARRAANNPEPAVFCPPLCVFNGAEGWRAREEDLFKGLVLSVECDQHPDEARRKLEDILGPATAIIRSGGQWIDPDNGGMQDKLHLHWRLKEPAIKTGEKDSLAALKQARDLATAIVGGDPSNIPVVHCLRWPGSWHRKATPRLCELISVNPDYEIDLDTALAELLEHAPPDAGKSNTARPQPADTPWRKLNERALEHLDEWVPKLFPTARKSRLGYRVSSADLGRGREEDLSLTTKGIKYFGDHDMGDPRGGRRTPIDCVMEWNHADLAEAVRWLEQHLNQPAPPEPLQEPPPHGENIGSNQSAWEEIKRQSAPGQPPPQEPPEEPQPKEPPPKQHRFTLNPFDNIVVSDKPSYLIKGIFPRTGLAVVWGPPKCGKSFWVFDLVMHVAIGREYRGRRVQQGTVVYCALEGGSGFAGRIEAWRQRHLDGYDQPVPFYLVDVSLDLVADQGALIADIRAQLGNIVPVVVVIDTLNRAIQGDENSSGDMSKFIRAADALRTEFGCLVIVVHHCGIANNRPRGHTSLAGADDAQISVVKNKDGVITASVEHMKDSEAGAKLACRLERVELGNDTEGDPLSSCVIIPVETPATAPKLGKGTQFALGMLKDLIAKDGVPLPAALEGVPAGTRAYLQ